MSGASLAMSGFRALTCSCCGNATVGRQWYNRDRGFGLCGTCFRWLRNRGTSEAEILANYGEDGVHFNLPLDAVPG